MKAIIGIGIPGSGKTTTLKVLAQQERLLYINADDIRQELTGDATNHTKEPEVWRLAYERIKTGLQEYGVVIDATHSKRSDRVRMTTFCRQHGAKHIAGYWFDTPLAVCRQRNRQRDRIVPDAVLTKMHRQLADTPPSNDEGFDEIIQVK